MTRALGHGSLRCGGAPSTADGGTFAFGNTLEALTAKVLGLKARGTPADRPLDRRTGEGRVHARDGDYADAHGWSVRWELPFSLPLGPWRIVVEGHTDDVAFNSSVSPRNNWELSVLRATAVVEVLGGNSQLAPELLTAAGRSQYHPRDPENKNRNRRIEVVLSPKLDGLYDLLDE